MAAGVSTVFRFRVQVRIQSVLNTHRAFVLEYIQSQREKLSGPIAVASNFKSLQPSRPSCKATMAMKAVDDEYSSGSDGDFDGAESYGI